jgi:hypothetical protein
MSITATSTGGTFELVPAGNHIARCYSMVEVGTEHDETYNVNRKVVRISWELPNERKVFNKDKGEQPFSVHKEYTLSMGEKANLRKDLESWRGKGFSEKECEAFDITKLIGVPCMLNVIHKTSGRGKEYAFVSSITPVPKGMTVPDAENPAFIFSFNEFDSVKFDVLPDWLKDRIRLTPEYNFIQNGGMETTEKLDQDNRQESTEDLPF